MPSRWGNVSQVTGNGGRRLMDIHSVKGMNHRRPYSKKRYAWFMMLNG